MRVTIDSTPVDVVDGTTVLGAVRAAGREVPTLCHDDRLSSAGTCRLCLVDVAGTGAVASCTTPAVDGMVVHTDSAPVHAATDRTLRLLTATLPARALDLPTELAALCRSHDVGPDAFAESGRGAGSDLSHPYVHLDRDLCIACGRCVQACAEIQGTFALTLGQRGAATTVVPGAGGLWADSPCVSCGACVDTCPTGALTTPSDGVAGAATTLVQTTCGYCGVGCSLDVEVADGGSGPEVLRIRPTSDGPVNRGHACVKGRFAHDFGRSGERLTTPLVRRDGRLEPAGWDEAIHLAADGIRRARDTHGPDSVAVISSARATNEENYLLQKLVRVVVGTNNIDNCSRVCHAPSAAGLTAAFGLSGGTNDLADIEAADLLLLAGCNPTEAHPVVGARIRQRVLRGTRLVVVDPRRTELADLADVHLRARPGSNVAVFNGIARLLLENHWVDEAYLADRSEGLDDLLPVVADYTPQRVTELSGVPEDALRTAAHLLGTARRPGIVYGLGVTEHAHGTDGVRTLANLAILCGAVGTETGAGVNPLRGQNNVQGASDMGALPDLLPGYQKVADEAARARAEAVWGTAPPPVPGLRIPDMFTAALDGRLRVLWIVGEDVVRTDPDSARVRAALAACDLVISQDIFLSDTAASADIVLPAASFLEKDGTFVNFDRRFQRVRPALAPPGAARTDFAIVHAMAAALGVDLGCRTPAEALDECGAVTPLFAGISHRRLDVEPAIHWPCRSADDPGTPRLYVDGFPTPTGRARLAARHWLPPGESPDADYPFVLVTGRRLAHYNSGSMTRRTANLAIEPTERLEVNPEDAADLGLVDGAMSMVTSRRGAVAVAVQVTDRVDRGQVFLAFHHPAVAVNALTSDHVDDVTSCPEYKVTAVRVSAADGGAR